MTEKLVCYSLEKANPVKRTKLHRELYGYQDNSNHCKYSYHRQGLLQLVHGKKICDAVFLISNQQVQKVVKLLKKYDAKVYVFDILERSNT